MKQALLRRVLREPVVHFIVVGFVLFFAGEIHRRQVDINRIVVTPQREAHLATRYELQFGAPPDRQTLTQLVERDIEEEILFRRGLALELDKDDEIVRRRIVQKMQFLLQDLTAPSEPSEAEIAAYYGAHADRYARPAQVTFSHVYFAGDAGEDVARARAANALELLASGKVRAGDVGDPFPDRHHFSAYEPEQVYRLFGRTQFSDATWSAPPERWMGPYRSGYGWHLIHVDARSPARQQELAVVRERVRTDYLLDAQTRSNATAFNELASEFTVVREPS